MERSWIYRATCIGYFFMLLVAGIMLFPALSMSEQYLRIAYLSVPPGEGPNIFVMDDDGSNVKQLTHGTALSAFPSWSPDGKRIAFDTDRDGRWGSNSENFEIYVMNADGSNLQNLTNTPRINERYPSWSPDGSKIIFTVYRPGGADTERWGIYTMDADGGNRTQLSNMIGVSDPSWSPDGSKITFRYFIGSNNYEICIMDADGGNIINLTQHPAWDSGPSWSPDGNSIAFSSDRLSPLMNFEIFRINVESKRVKQLTDFPGWDGDPCWSPDGEKIAFASNRDGQFDIYVMDASRGGAIRLTETPWDERFPAWSPPLSMAVTSAGKYAARWGWIKWKSK